jgi:hypothetical protein
MRHTLVHPIRARRVRRTREEVARLLTDFRSSGVSQSAFARSNGISQPTLSYWLRSAHRRTGEKAEDSPRLVPVKITAVPGVLPAPTRSGFELDLPRGLRLWIPADFDEDALRRLLPILAGEQGRC